MHPQSIPHDLVDIGVNLADAVFDGDRVAVIDRAVAAGVRRLVITGTTVAESERAVEVARTRPGVLFATAGIHPNHSHEAEPDAIAAVRALQQQPEVVAIGECGFDCVRDRSPLAVQERIFRPFFTTKRQGAGTGMGLDIVYRIVVNRHGGTIRLASEPGDTRFVVRLPSTPPLDHATADGGGG